MNLDMIIDPCFLQMFLDLYKRACPSVRWSVGKNRCNKAWGNEQRGGMRDDEDGATSSLE